MDLRKSGNTPSTEIKKCPYYDPVTRETVKPGKICPEYNTPRGCPYAHPFEFDKWDGETPFVVPVVKPNPDPSLKPPNSTQKAAHDTAMPDGIEDASRDMDVDDSQTQPSVSLEDALKARPEPSIKQTKTPTFIPPSQDPAPAPRLSLQKEAVEEFLLHLIAAVQHYRRESIASISLAKFKADYKALLHFYNESEKGESLQDIMSPGEKKAWIRQREEMTKELDDIESAKWGWIDGLVSMEGKSQVSGSSRVGYGEDSEMKDATAVVVPEVILSEEEDMIVDALNHHRARLQRGFIGEQVAHLRTRMDRIRAFMERKEARKSFTGGSSSGPAATNADADTEMKDSEHSVDTRSILKVATNDLKRLEDLQEMAENMSSPIDEAEDWSTADIRGEWFEQGMRAAIDEITRDFIQQERAREAVDSNAAKESLAQGQAPMPTEMVEQMKGKLEEITTIRDTSESLLRIIGPVGLFDENTLPHLSIVFQSISKASETLESSLEAIKSSLSERRISLAMPSATHSTSRSPLTSRTTEWHERHLGAHPPLQEARIAQAVSPHLPSQKEVQGQQRAAWFSEYEELRELAERIVGPIVDRTDKQEDTLMELERGRRTGVGGGMHGEEGGLVSMHVSVEGAMG